MFNQAKYIVGPLASTTLGVVGAIVFPEMCDHRQMAQRTMVDGEVVSAGFVSISSDPGTHEIDVTLHGKSQSLRVESNPKYTNMVRLALGLETQ